MSAYSMPLCTILTKCPAPSGPTWVQHGVPSTVGGDGLEERADGVVRLLGASGHDARPLEGALLAAGDAGADEVDPLRPQRRLAPAGVVEVGVAAVEEHVARLQVCGQLGDHGIGRRPCGHHHEDTAWALERGDEVVDRVSSGRTCPRRRMRRSGHPCVPGSGCGRRRRSRGGQSCGPGCHPSRRAPSPRCQPSGAGRRVHRRPLTLGGHRRSSSQRHCSTPSCRTAK